MSSIPKGKKNCNISNSQWIIEISAQIIGGSVALKSLFSKVDQLESSHNVYRQFSYIHKSLSKQLSYCPVDSLVIFMLPCTRVM